MGEEWSRYGHGQFNEGRMVMLQKSPVNGGKLVMLRRWPI